MYNLPQLGPHRLAVRTSGSHPDNWGSIPHEVTFIVENDIINQMIKFKRSNLLLIILALLLLLTSRLLLIDQIPTSMARDELVYSLTAKSIAKIGQPLIGSWQPLSLTPFDSMFAELPATIMIPAAKVFDHPFVSARATHAVLGIIFPFIFAWFVVGLFQDKKIFFMALFVAIFNPWLWQFSRMNFDPFLSLFFLIAASAVYLNTSSYKKLLCLPLFFISFFMYQGFKVLIPAWILVLVFYNCWANRQQLKQKILISNLVILFVSLIGIGTYYRLALPKQTASDRLDNIILLNQNLQATTVNQQRRTTIDNPLIRLASNKATMLARHFLINYLKAFDLEKLFINSEKSVNQFSLENHGYFYLIDLGLLGIGLYHLIKNKKRELYLIVGLVLVAPMASLVMSQGYSATFRNSGLFIVLLSVISFGFQQLLVNQTGKKIILTLYILSATNFAYQYFFTYPIRSADFLFHEQKILAEYLYRLPPEQKVAIHAQAYQNYFEAYIFYNNLIPNIDRQQIIITDDSIRYRQLTFTNQCLNSNQNQDETIIWEIGQIETCHQDDLPPTTTELLLAPIKLVQIVRIIDSGGILNIRNDTLCHDFDLKSYIAPQSLVIFDLKQLKNKQFCQNWLVRTEQ